MLTRCCCWTIAALLSAGCSGGRSQSEVRKRVADKEVNTKHLKGTTDVLKNYRYGERPDSKTTKRKESVSSDGRAK